MKNHSAGSETRFPIRDAHEVAFALNIGLLLTAVFYLVYYYVPALQLIARDLEGMDRAISKYLHLLPGSTERVLSIANVPKDVITGGYFAFFFPALVLALCICILLRLLRRTRVADEVLRSAAGFAALGGVPLWWLWASFRAGHWWWWTPLLKIQFYEAAAAVFCVAAYLYGKWAVPIWVSLVVLLAHCAFWMWQLRFSFRQLAWGWGGSIAILPAVGLFAGLMWILYCGRGSVRFARPIGDALSG